VRNAAPILFLVFLTPCVEFLTGSTSFGAAVTVPSAAFTFFLLTWPSYALPVLLIREAVVAWNKGIASLLALGISYGALNEGLLAKTYFAVNPNSPVLGGGAGRWIGINWPWVTEITLFHMIVSISVPVVLGFLIFPETRHVRFLSDRTIRWFIGLLLFEVVGILTLESLFSATFRALLPLMLLPVGILVLGILLARRLPNPSAGRILRGRFSRPLPLILASLGFFLVTFIPVLVFFPVPFVPDWLPGMLLWKLGPAAAVLATIYPIGCAFLALRFFARYSLTEIQLLSLVTGAMLIPLTTALAIHDIPQGDWFAAGVYIACIIAAARRIRARSATTGPGSLATGRPPESDGSSVAPTARTGARAHILGPAPYDSPYAMFIAAHVSGSPAWLRRVGFRPSCSRTWWTSRPTPRPTSGGPCDCSGNRKRSWGR
jgi:hypothetical protein